jgi:2-dehydro-3-deoxyphosphogluconate aldolase/(4S)-4-hydroxy-2-oxoglutarate aldolase
LRGDAPTILRELVREADLLFAEERDMALILRRDFSEVPAQDRFHAAATEAAAHFQTLAFCPTGGITQASVKSYLDLPNVLCAGGSWLAPADAMAKKDWPLIEALAAKAAASRTGASR